MCQDLIVRFFQPGPGCRIYPQLIHRNSHSIHGPKRPKTAPKPNKIRPLPPLRVIHCCGKIKFFEFLKDSGKKCYFVLV
jgi:hypothetical protein